MKTSLPASVGDAGGGSGGTLFWLLALLAMTAVGRAALAKHRLKLAAEPDIGRIRT